MSAPINVRLQSPTISIPDWQQVAAAWMNLNTEVGGNPDFYPLTVKAVYVIGIIHDLCESVSYLLRHPNAKATTYIPAYGICASGIELLGRCINGNFNTRNNTPDLKTGLKWLSSSPQKNIPDTHVLITTSRGSYTVAMLAALRHFAAHGQATTERTTAGYQFGNIDYEILGKMPSLIANGLERYWDQLIHSNDDNLCNHLAQANVIALRNWPVYKSLSLFERDDAGRYHSITEIFSKFDWHV
jgi:hypothetical protein